MLQRILSLPPRPFEKLEENQPSAPPGSWETLLKPAYPEKATEQTLKRHPPCPHTTTPHVCVQRENSSQFKGHGHVDSAPAGQGAPAAARGSRAGTDSALGPNREPAIGGRVTRRLGGGGWEGRCPRFAPAPTTLPTVDDQGDVRKPVLLPLLIQSVQDHLVMFRELLQAFHRLLGLHGRRVALQKRSMIVGTHELGAGARRPKSSRQPTPTPQQREREGGKGKASGEKGERRRRKEGWAGGGRGPDRGRPTREPDLIGAGRRELEPGGRRGRRRAPGAQVRRGGDRQPPPPANGRPALPPGAGSRRPGTRSGPRPTTTPRVASPSPALPPSPVSPAPNGPALTQGRRSGPGLRVTDVDVMRHRVGLG